MAPSALLALSLLALPALADAPVGASDGTAAPEPVPWGEEGHRIAARAAAELLPSSVPGFLRGSGAVARLAWLDSEPDRWRSDAYEAMNEAFAYDHYIDLERVPSGALDARDRWSYLALLHRETDLDRPARDAGLLPYRIVELYQRLVSGLRRWREATDGRERRWIAGRVIHDAGILGHYVTDASQPQHTTIHYNGWAEGAPNPEGFTVSRELHFRFESAFVRAHVRPDDVRDRLADAAPRELDDVPAAVRAMIVESHGEVRRLYRIQRDHGFDPAIAAAPEARTFAVERLVAGARMLRDLWWTAWLRSGEPGPAPR